MQTSLNLCNVLAMKVGGGAPRPFTPAILTALSTPVVSGSGTVQKVFKGVG